MVHLDNVVAMLAQEGIEARGLLDSGLWLDVQPVTNTGMGDTLLKQAEYVYGFANISSAIISDDCAAAYPGEEYKWCVSDEHAAQRGPRPARGTHAPTDASSRLFAASSGSTECRS
jgi:hypothetical protein